MLVIFLFVSCVFTTRAQNLDSIPEKQRDSILISVAKEVVLKHGSGYYREYKEPLPLNPYSSKEEISSFFCTFAPLFI